MGILAHTLVIGWLWVGWWRDPSPFQALSWPEGPFALLVLWVLWHVQVSQSLGDLKTCKYLFFILLISQETAVRLNTLLLIRESQKVTTMIGEIME